MTLFTVCQINGENFVNFCGLPRKHELYEMKFGLLTEIGCTFKIDHIIKLNSFSLKFNLWFRNCKICCWKSKFPDFASLQKISKDISFSMKLVNYCPKTYICTYINCLGRKWSRIYFEIDRAPSELLLPSAKISAQIGWIGLAA